jgi:hypothetical protein
MTTWRVASDLAAIMVPIGVVGAVIAGLCALVAGIAIVRRASGLCGGAVGIWIPAAMLSSVAGFANQWMPLLLSSAALVGMLVIGAVVRGVMNAKGIELPERKAEAEALADAPSSAPAPATSAVPVLARSNPVRAA